MKTLLQFFFVFMLQQAASLDCWAAKWFVDCKAPGTQNSGKSFEQAWTNLASIDWDQLKPGSIIELAKGDYSGQSLVIRQSGTSNEPIIVRVARDPDKKGLVRIGSVNFGKNNWVTVNGALEEGFEVPQAVALVESITNNIGIQIHGRGTGVRAAGPNTGIRLLWTQVYKCGTTGRPAEEGLRYIGPAYESEIAYCWFLDNIYGDAITYVKNNAPDWGQLSIHDCIIDNVGDDAMQIAGGGVDVYRCLIRHRTHGEGGHTDCFQTWSSHYRIHHNIIQNFASQRGSEYNSISYAQFSKPVVGNFFFYNNLIYDDDANRLGSPGLKLIFDAWWARGKHNPEVRIENILIANNLFAKPKAQNVGWTLHGRSDRSRGTNDSYTISNCLVANNIFLDGYRMTSGQLQGAVIALPGPRTGHPSVKVDASSLGFLNNIIKGPNSRISYMGKTHESAESVNRLTGAGENRSQLPKFQAYNLLRPPYDFHLHSSDKIARNRGLDLAAWVHLAPMLDRDLDGNPRGREGAWDIGPYEFSP